MLDISEGGLRLATRLCLSEGDEIHLSLHPNRGDAAVRVNGIVWSSKKRSGARGDATSSMLGIMISAPPRSYCKLLAGLASSAPGGGCATPSLDARPAKISAAAAARLDEKTHLESVTIVSEPPADPSLPRPKFPLPPPKTNDPETLPRFAVRVKQRSGPRTRRLELRAASVYEVERQILVDLGDDWEILEISSTERTTPPS